MSLCLQSARPEDSRGISVESRLLLTTALRLLGAFVVGMQALVSNGGSVCEVVVVCVGMQALLMMRPNPGTENSTCSNRCE